MKKNKNCGGAVAMLLGALAGCSTIDQHVRVPDWPELKVIEHHVGEVEMRDRCSRYTPPLTFTLGCTVFRFGPREAHIYVSSDFPDPRVLAHERLHAAGYDHVGSDYMKRAWQRWQERNGTARVAREER